MAEGGGCRVRMSYLVFVVFVLLWLSSGGGGSAVG